MPSFVKRVNNINPKRSWSYWSYGLTGIFFAGLLICGFAVYQDYGISFDEFWELDTGLISLKYVVEVWRPELIQEIPWLQHYPPLETYIDADHGVTVALPLVVLKSLTGIHSYDQTFLFRHLITFLISYIGIFFFYLLCREQFKSNGWALLGSILLVLSPRIFADSFYNTKDIPFLSFCIIATYTMVRFLKKPTYWLAVGHAFTCALAIDTRIMGVLLPVITGLFIFLLLIQNKQFLFLYYKQILLYLLLLLPFVIMLWPYLWVDPFHKLITIWQNMKHFRWEGGTNLYFGKYIPADNLPWHYIPGWIFITTPIAYSFFFIIGLGMIVFRFWQNPTKNILSLVGIAFLFSAIGAIVFVNALLYDGWRHLFFVYFAFLLISLSGIYELWHLSFKNARWQPLIRISTAGFIGVCFFSTLRFMILNHPYQNAYFSLISGAEAEVKFERDYWGLSYRQGLEYILKHDKSAVIKYNSEDLPGKLNAFIFPDEVRKRLKYVPLKEATYFLSTYRWRPQPYPYREIYKIEVEGLKIMSVFKLK